MERHGDRCAAAAAAATSKSVAAAAASAAATAAAIGLACRQDIETAAAPSSTAAALTVGSRRSGSAGLGNELSVHVDRSVANRSADRRP